MWYVKFGSLRFNWGWFDDALLFLFLDDGVILVVDAGTVKFS